MIFKSMRLETPGRRGGEQEAGVEAWGSPTPRGQQTGGRAQEPAGQRETLPRGVTRG